MTEPGPRPCSRAPGSLSAWAVSQKSHDPSTHHTHSSGSLLTVGICRPLKVGIYRGVLDGAADKIPRALAVTGRGGEKVAEACEHLTDALVAIVPRLDQHTPANTPLSTGDEVTLTMLSLGDTVFCLARQISVVRFWAFPPNDQIRVIKGRLI